MLKLTKRCPKISTPSSKLDLERIFHKQQSSLGGIQNVILRDFANLSESCMKESCLYQRAGNRVLKNHKKDFLKGQVSHAVAEKLIEISKILSASQEVFERRIVGKSLTLEDRDLLKKGIAILKRFRETNFKKELANLINHEEDQIATRAMVGSFFGLY